MLKPGKERSAICEARVDTKIQRIIIDGVNRKFILANSWRITKMGGELIDIRRVIK